MGELLEDVGVALACLPVVWTATFRRQTGIAGDEGFLRFILNVVSVFINACSECIALFHCEQTTVSSVIPHCHEMYRYVSTMQALFNVTVNLIKGRGVDEITSTIIASRNLHAASGFVVLLHLCLLKPWVISISDGAQCTRYLCTRRYLWRRMITFCRVS